MKKHILSLFLIFSLFSGVVFAASDDFTDSNGTALATHDAKWTQVSAGRPVSNFEIQSNVLQVTGDGVAAGACYVNSQSADQMSQAVLKANGTNYERYVGVRFDYSGSTYGYAAALTGPSGGNWTALKLYKNVSYISGSGVAGSWAQASDHTIKITVSGTGQNNVTINVWVDGNLEIEDWVDTDASTYDSGYPGIFTGLINISDSGFDDWTDADAVAPVAAFSGTPLSGDKPLEVTFTDASTNTPTSWAWDFGDLSCPTADECNDQNPVHEYADAGTYTVELTATNAGGSDDETKEDYITVSEPAPVAAFSADDTTPDAQVAVTFTDASTGEITDWEWDFGDDTCPAAAECDDEDPEHTYNTPGTYTVSLIVYGPGGNDEEEKVDYIEVSPLGGGAILLYQ